MSSYTINEDFFDSPWSEEKAYVLGYFFADSSIYRGEIRDRYEITISGSRLESLETIKELMESDHPIRQVGPGSYQIKVGSRQLVEYLEQLGLSDNKSETLTYPQGIPQDYERHFVRGYFDGKGSFMIESGRRIVSNFSGASLEFMEALRDRLVVHGMSRANIHQYGEGGSSNMIRYYVRDTRHLVSLLYDEARIFSREQRERYLGGYRNQTSPTQE